jgi:hypothetical protein
LLEPTKGTQGREMTRNVRIASVLVLAGLLSVMAPTIASASTPLLSGYGGPGAGEQAIVGSVLLAPHGSGGSGGSSSGSAGSGGQPQSSVSASGGSTSSPTASGGSGPTVRSGSSSSSPSKSGGGTGGAAPQTGVHASAKATYVYPSSLRSNSTDSSLLGLSAGDVLALIAMILILGCVGALTLRLARLQP